MSPLFAQHVPQGTNVWLDLLALPVAAYLLWGVIRWLNERDDPREWRERKRPPDAP
jgi:hypothetical protein